MARTLLTAQDCTDHVHLIVGSGPLAASRCAKSLEVGAHPVLVAPEVDNNNNANSLHYTLVKLIEDGLIRWTRKAFQEADLKTLGRQEVDFYVDAVFVATATEHAAKEDAETISKLCKKLRIPVNVVDAPALCTFTLLSTHTDGPLQIGITTSGRGCALSSRIRREIVSTLPRDFGEAIERLGSLRQRIWEEDLKQPATVSNMSDTTSTAATIATLTEEAKAHAEAKGEDIDDEAVSQKHSFNALIREDDQSPETARTRRIRWLSQICEYWPLSRLAAITDEDVSRIFDAYTSSESNSSHDVDELEGQLLLLTSSAVARKGSISLVGSGPGHPSLLTIAAHNAIKTADFILSDKLVPAEVLALIPRRTPVHIARKFPGNADAAQEEMLGLALKALNEGKQVLRLKQGDPYLYGRGAEEVAFFRAHGFEAVVVPGVTSALSAPMFAEIPVTHRAVAEEVLICTGTGRKGVAPVPPEYKKSRTAVFLMALHRLESLVESLTTEAAAATEAATTTTATATAAKQDHSTPKITQARTLWPKDIPCAVIERASCPDQRVIRSTLQHVCQAVQEEGSRPPGLLVVGYACEVLHKLSGDKRWTTQEGFRALDGLLLTNVAGSGLSIVKEEQGTETNTPSST